MIRSSRTAALVYRARAPLGDQERADWARVLEAIAAHAGSDWTPAWSATAQELARQPGAPRAGRIRALATRWGSALSIAPLIARQGPGFRLAWDPTRGRFSIRPPAPLAPSS